MSDGRSDAKYKNLPILGPEALMQKELEEASSKLQASLATAKEHLQKRHPDIDKMQFKPTGGTKQDNNKPQVSLIPSEAIIEMAKAFTYGAQKYSAHNFKLGIKYSRLIDAALRHLLAFNSGEDIDSESNNNHLGHALASMAMLTYMYHNRTDLDDRYKETK